MLALSPALGRHAAGVGDRASVGAVRRAICRGRRDSGDRRGRRRSRPRCERLLAGRSRPLVSVMLANNETGVIQPVAEAAAIVHAAGGLLHVDAVQGPGRIACDFKALGADLMTLSAHKIGGPQGVGALIRRDGSAARRADPGRRPGARARGPAPRMWPGIAGFGAAAEAVRAGLARRGRPDGGLARPAGSRPQGRGRRRRSFSARKSPRLPNTTLFSRRPG